MFEALKETGDTLELDDLFDMYDRFTEYVTGRVGTFDRAQTWGLDGAVSMRAWLRAHASMAYGSAKVWCARAASIDRLPVTRAAYAKGELCTAKVDLIAAHVTGRRVGLFAEHESDLIPTLLALTVKQTDTVLEKWVRHADAILEEEEPVEREESASWGIDKTRRGRLGANLNEGHSANLDQALQIAETKDCEGEPARTASQRRVDALNDIVAFFLANHTKTSSVKNRPHVTIVQTAKEHRDGLGAATIDGLQLHQRTVHQLCCDSTINVVTLGDDGEILHYGRQLRLAPVALFQALALVDKHCRYPGCDRRPSWCDAHHVLYWENDGPTCITNMALLCSRHHHLIHKKGWRVELLPDRTLVVTTPNDRQLVSRPPP